MPSDIVLVAIIGAAGSVVAAALALIGIWISLGNRAVVIEAKAIAQKTEINTNAMKDALVASTKLASHAEGKEEGRIEGEAKAANLAAGALAAHTTTP